MNGKSLDILQNQLEKLKQLFPEAVTEGKVDWEKLQATLGRENLEFQNERYVLNWAGKVDAFKVLQQSTTATLKPAPEESINFDTTENVFIEGENLEVLKVLQKAYYGKVKCIIIDPPYNTGSDSFIYPDSFKESKEEYQKRIGEKDEEGYLLKEGYFRKNSKDSGHYHSNWLSMMYPRLFLAKNLLSDDGVIFIHIDDNEVHNLRMVMNEIFGEENFAGEIIWQTATDNNPTQIAIEHEYILCYTKNVLLHDAWEVETEKGKFIKKQYEELKNKLGKDYEAIQNDLRKWIKSQNKNGIDLSGVSHYSYVDAIGVFYPGNSANTIPGGYTYDIIHPITKKVCAKPNYGYRFKKDTFDDAEKRGDILWGENENIIPKIKKRLETATEKLKSYYYEDNRNTTNELKNLFDGKKIFDNPKSNRLLKHYLKFVISKDDIVLDFFAGSATTAQAVLELNKEDGGNRKFILVQLPEKCDEESEAYKAGYKTIADIGKERIRRVIKKIEEEIKESKNLLSDIEENKSLDLGFKVFKLSSSNFKIWRGNEITEENLEQQLDSFTNPVREGSEKENMLYELILKAGYLLTDKVEANEKYYSVNDGELIIALEDLPAGQAGMNQELINTIISAKPQKVITLDKLFTDNDQLKTNTVLQMRDAEIDFKTI
jgi:adenine-specific DNA-methyltransferase